MDCKTCRHNIYRGSIPDWVSCSHPITRQKTPKPETGDPAWVNAMTFDLKASEMSAFNLHSDCPTYEAPADAEVVS